jgi:hypothetical protein
MGKRPTEKTFQFILASYEDWAPIEIVHCPRDYKPSQRCHQNNDFGYQNSPQHTP